MAIVLRASGTAFTSQGSGVSLIVTRPSGVTSGDFMLQLVFRDQATTAYSLIPSGWTQIATVASGASTNFDVDWFFKFAGGSEPATYTWTLSANNLYGGPFVTYGGCSTSSPINAAAGAFTLSGTSISAPAITTTQPQCWLVVAFADWLGTTWTFPAGYTQEVAASGGGPYLFDLGPVAVGSQPVVGASGTVGSDTFVGQRIALAPADVAISASEAVGLTEISAGDLAAMLNETIADTANLVSSSVAPAGDTFEVSLGTAPAAIDLTGMPGVLNYQYRGTVTGGRRIDLTVVLLCNNTPVQTWTLPDIQSTFLIAPLQLSSVGLAAIVPGGALSLRTTAAQV